VVCATEGRTAEPIKTSPPMDVLWFRLSRKPDDADEPLGHFDGQSIIVVLNRFDYWQLGYVIPKGKYQDVRAAGLEHLHQVIANGVPNLAERVQEIKEWKQISVLSVESNRLPRWYRPGLLLIGDAAHVMSPVGGVGINYAIQDAVVAANVLGNKLKYGIVRRRDLAEVQRKRELPTRVIQALQNMVQRFVLARVLNAKKPLIVPAFVPFLVRLPLLRDLPARIIALGLWPVHVKG
jgi:2-polyprenyl-6-methoxyphenol hydroxylase-like FAD-dependent oxidoreductase